MLETVTGIIRQVVETAAAESAATLWRQPLVAVVSTDKEEFGLLKQVVSPSHLLPRDILPSAQSVICFFLPFAKGVVQGNSGGDLASRGWASAYITTNDLIARINERLAGLMAARGFEARTIPATHNFDEARLVSDWSHRHVAWIAGLGSFGINNMLITESGACGRLGSVVTSCRFDSPAVIDRRERCLNKIDGSCGVCRKLCMFGAYGPEGGYDRFRCYEKCLENAAYHEEIGYADVCGKCTVGLPCSLRDPSERSKMG